MTEERWKMKRVSRSRKRDNTPKRIKKLIKKGWKWTIWYDCDGKKHDVITYDGPWQGYKEKEINEMSIGDFDLLLAEKVFK